VGAPHRRTGGKSGATCDDANLKRRVLSAAVLIPIALIATFAGSWAFTALCTIAAGGILWEWTCLVRGQPDARILVPGWTGLLIAAVLAGFGLPGAAAGTMLIEAVLAALAVIAWPRGEELSESFSPVAWAAGGLLYAGAALVPSVILRNDPNWGLTSLLFLFATIWFTDIFAFFCGRIIDGPLLLPKVSPRKTWAGAIGGAVGGVTAALALAHAVGIGKLGIVGIVALLLSVLAQAGDLFESMVKRRFGAKDASMLIPGHGGLMDRLDGFLVAAFAAALIGVLHAGAGSPAKGLLLW